MIVVFATLFAGLWAAWYQIVSGHFKDKPKDEFVILRVFVLASIAMGILAHYAHGLMEMTMTKNRSCSQIVDLLSEAEIRSGK